MLKTFTIRQQTAKIASVYALGSGVVTVDETNKRQFFDLFKKRGADVNCMKTIDNTGDAGLEETIVNEKTKIVSETEIVNEKPSRLLLEGFAGDDYVYSLHSNHTLRFCAISDYNTVLFEMPVNVLNFSNVLVLPVLEKNQVGCFYIATVSTTDPDSFDMYFVNIINKTLNRLLKQVKYTEPELNFGNIMQFEYLGDSRTIAVGYEDGSVYLFQMAKNFEKIESSNMLIHFPAMYNKDSDKETECDHPLLSFAYSLDSSILYMGHAKSNCIYSYETKTNRIKTTKHKKVLSVSNIAVLSDSKVLFLTWEHGSVYSLDFTTTESKLHVIYTIPEKPNIQMVDIDPTGDTTVPHPFKAASRSYNKINILKVIPKEQLQKSYLDTTSKVLLKRYSHVITHDHVALGLDSGVVIILQL
ncbi:hypothetical protein QEN19_003904 [Hanseniaspora menglaensis]